MEDRELAFFLYKTAEHNRSLALDNFVKSNAPNADELCTKKLNFDQVMKKMASSENQDQSFNSAEIQKNLNESSETVKVSGSVRQNAIDFAQSALVNSSMRRLLAHSFKQSRLVIDQFKPS